MSNSDDKGDWSHDSASLFRAARRAHDPTAAERARLAALSARIRSAEGATIASGSGVNIAARRAPEIARLVAGVSLGVVCIAAAAFVFVRVDRRPAEPALAAKPVPASVPSAPPPTPTLPERAAPPPELEAPAQAAAVAPEDARPRARWRSGDGKQRARASVERQRASRVATAPGSSNSAPNDDAAPVTAPENGTTSERASSTAATRATRATRATTAIQRTAPRAASRLEPGSEASRAARKPVPTVLDAASTELAMMKRIQGALRDADFSKALALCAEHARRWPDGVFEHEREGVRAIASCGMRSDDAALRAKRFLTMHPDAPVALRVSAACARQLTKR